MMGLLESVKQQDDLRRSIGSSLSALFGDLRLTPSNDEEMRASEPSDMLAYLLGSDAPLTMVPARVPNPLRSVFGLSHGGPAPPSSRPSVKPPSLGAPAEPQVRIPFTEAPIIGDTELSDTTQIGSDAPVQGSMAPAMVDLPPPAQVSKVQPTPDEMQFYLRLGAAIMQLLSEKNISVAQAAAQNDIKIDALRSIALGEGGNMISLAETYRLMANLGADRISKGSNLMMLFVPQKAA